jgi:hypothetical protein
MIDKSYIIAVRCTGEVFQMVVDNERSDSLKLLGNFPAYTLTEAAQRMGITRSLRGRKLRYFRVDQGEYDRITDPSTEMIAILKYGSDVTPIFSVDYHEAVESVRRIKSMAIQDDDLIDRLMVDEMLKLITVLDLPEERQQRRNSTNLNTHGIKYGDRVIIDQPTSSQLLYTDSPTQLFGMVTRVSNSSYCIQPYVPNQHMRRKINYWFTDKQPVLDVVSQARGIELIEHPGAGSNLVVPGAPWELTGRRLVKIPLGHDDLNIDAFHLDQSVDMSYRFDKISNSVRALTPSETACWVMS